VLFEQRYMTDVYFEGPGVRRLLSDVAVNSFAMFGPMKAKQLLVCNEEGQYMGDAILFGLGEEKVSLVGGPVAANWVSFQAERGGYDVVISRDESAPVSAGGTPGLPLLGAGPPCPRYRLGRARRSASADQVFQHRGF
jgi:vanillate/3-O-methylgallate O-demethylase